MKSEMLDTHSRDVLDEALKAGTISQSVYKTFYTTIEELNLEEDTRISQVRILNAGALDFVTDRASYKTYRKMMMINSDCKVQ